MIIADENLEQHWIDLLRSKHFEVYSIRENNPGISDREMARFVSSKNGWLITEDKDFGELIFSYGIQAMSVIFLRYDQPKYHQVEEFLLNSLNDYANHNGHLFITISKNKVRMRSL